jgi:toxin ParE1/3/4
MPNKYSIKWTEIARDDLEEIIEYIAVEDEERALVILDRIEKKVNELYNFPKKGRYIPEFELYNIFTYKEIIESPWRIIYKIDSNIVYIMSILDGRRNIEDILIKRIMNKRI